MNAYITILYYGVVENYAIYYTDQTHAEIIHMIKSVAKYKDIDFIIQVPNIMDIKYAHNSLYKEIAKIPYNRSEYIIMFSEIESIKKSHNYTVKAAIDETIIHKKTHSSIIYQFFAIPKCTLCKKREACFEKSKQCSVCADIKKYLKYHNKYDKLITVYDH